MSNIVVAPITLEGKLVRLEPLTLQRLDELIEAGRSPELWTYTRSRPLNTPEAMRTQVLGLLQAQSKGTDLPFLTVHRPNNRVAGMTRFMDIQPDNRAVEIGGTFVAPEFQRTVVNTEAKYLMLRHAFEVWECLRVQFKTDVRNTASQRAIERLGAVPEGVLRDHIILHDGTIRSSIYYSILAREWPQIKARLVEKLSV
jgi:RimJ/RimL family protein N-acetyltransferase